MAGAVDPLEGMDVPQVTQADFITVDDADRALYRLTRLTDQLEAIKSWAKEARERLAPQIESARDTVALFMEHLRRSTGQNSMKLPAGELAIRRRPKELIRDDEALVKLLDDQIGDDEKFWKVEPKWSEIMKLVEAQDDGTFVVKATGEVVDDRILRKVEGEEEFSVSAKDKTGRKL